MREFKNKSIFWILPLIVGMLLIIYIAVHLPMVNNLKNMTLKNIHMAAHYKMTILERDINQAMVGAKGISTRSLLRESLFNYSNGEIDLEQLKEISQNRFTDGIGSLEGLEKAIRVTNGEIIALYKGMPDYNIELNNLRDISYDISPDRDILQIVSPVTSNGEILGHDVFIFNLVPTIKKLEMDDLKGTLISKSEMDGLLSNKEFVETDAHHLTAEDDEFVYHIERIGDTGSYLYISADKDMIYGSVNQIAKRNLLEFIIIGIVFVLAAALITSRLAKGKIDELEQGRNKYRSQYLIDPLTGAYTRRILSEGHDENLISEEFSGIAVMMDLTDFKRINDNHGHKEGDKVLVKLVEIMSESLREEDLIIRYGGDEFLVLLNDCEMEEAKTIIDRVRQNFKGSPEFKYNVDFDYGMETIGSYSELADSIIKSDEIMYRRKNRA